MKWNSQLSPVFISIEPLINYRKFMAFLETTCLDFFRLNVIYFVIILLLHNHTFFCISESSFFYSFFCFFLGVEDCFFQKQRKHRERKRKIDLSIILLFFLVLILFFFPLFLFFLILKFDTWDNPSLNFDN